MTFCFQGQQKISLGIGVPKRDWELAHSAVKSGAKLGSGAFGIVRRGVLTLSDRGNVNVAIKVSQNFDSHVQSLHMQLFSQEANLTKCTKEQIKEFMNEARVMRKFKHSNVIEFFGRYSQRKPAIDTITFFNPKSTSGVAVGEEPLMIVMELATDGALKAGFTIAYLTKAQPNGPTIPTSGLSSKTSARRSRQAVYVLRSCRRHVAHSHKQHRWVAT